MFGSAAARSRTALGNKAEQSRPGCSTVRVKGMHPNVDLTSLALRHPGRRAGGMREAPNRSTTPAHQAGAGTPPKGPALLSPADFSRQVAPSLWGVIAKGPRGEEIRGSAVAVAPQRLLTTCGLVMNRDHIGLSRLKQYRRSRLDRVFGDRGLCVVAVPGAGLDPAAGLRTVGDLAVGETTYAVTNLTSADLRFARSSSSPRPGRARPQTGDHSRVP